MRFFSQFFCSQVCFMTFLVVSLMPFTLNSIHPAYMCVHISYTNFIATILWWWWIRCECKLPEETRHMWIPTTTTTTLNIWWTGNLHQKRARDSKYSICRFSYFLLFVKATTCSNATYSVHSPTYIPIFLFCCCCFQVKTFTHMKWEKKIYKQIK